MHFEPEIVYEEPATGNYHYFVQEVSQPKTISQEQKRPGKEPSLPDHELSPEELRRRNNRRRRNREAAARVRERRLGKMQMLEEEVSILKSQHKNLHSENENLRQQLKKLQKELETGKSSHKKSQNSNPARSLHRLTRQISNTDVPEDAPIVPKSENLEVFQNDHPTMVCTPGGTFVLTPISRDAQFSFPEPQTVRNSSDSEYKMILLNL